MPCHYQENPSQAEASSYKTNNQPGFAGASFSSRYSSGPVRETDSQAEASYISARFIQDEA